MHSLGRFSLLTALPFCLACGADDLTESQNGLPTAIIGDIGNITQFQEVTFDASQSSDLDGQIVSYAWDFGDNSAVEVTSSSLPHTFGDVGTFEVALTVTDNKGASDTATKRVDVLPPGANQSPTARCWGEIAGQLPPGVVNPASTLTLTAVGNDDVAITSWLWNFNDGTADTSGTLIDGETNQVIHTFDNPTSQQRVTSAVLTVTDGTGATGGCTIDIIVLPGSTTTVSCYGAAVGQTPPSVLAAGAAATLTGYVPTDAAITSWSWNFNDGTPADNGSLLNTSTNQVIHTFDNPTGAQRLTHVTLEVIDVDGGDATCQIDIVVLPEQGPAGDYSGPWSWQLAAGEIRDPSGIGACSFQDSELEIQVNGSALTFVEMYLGSPAASYSGSLIGDQFTVTDGIQYVQATFTSATTFLGQYWIVDSSGFFPECEVRRDVEGFKQ